MTKFYQENPLIMLGSAILSIIIIILALSKYKNKIGYLFIFLGTVTLLSIITDNMIIIFIVALLTLIPYKIYINKIK